MNQFNALHHSLKLLGYKSYRQYLDSELWKDIRERVFERCGKKCCICNSDKNIQIHHSRYGYRVLMGKKNSSLFPLCGRCHQEIHKRKNTDLKSAMKEVRKEFG